MATVAVYDYRDARDRLMYRVRRSQPKKFAILSSTGRELPRLPERTVLYRFPELLASSKTDVIFVTEGEKDADRLASLGLVATTNPGGCRVGWKDEYTAHFTSRPVLILADNDRPGIRHAELVERALLGVAEAVAILKLPRLRRSEDVSDWLDFRSGTRNELLERANKLLSSGRTSPPPPPKGGHARRHLIFSSSLPSSERLCLLAIYHFCNDPETRIQDLADATGLHRVSVQRIVGKLVQKGMLSRDGKRWTIAWERV